MAIFSWFNSGVDDFKAAYLMMLKLHIQAKDQLLIQGMAAGIRGSMVFIDTL